MRFEDTFEELKKINVELSRRYGFLKIFSWRRPALIKVPQSPTTAFLWFEIFHALLIQGFTYGTAGVHGTQLKTFPSIRFMAFLNKIIFGESLTFSESESSKFFSWPEDDFP